MEYCLSNGFELSSALMVFAVCQDSKVLRTRLPLSITRAFSKSNRWLFDQAWLAIFEPFEPFQQEFPSPKGCVSLGESENGFVIPDQMDSSTPKKRKIRKRIILS